MAMKKVELNIVAENGRSSNSVWSSHQSYPTLRVGEIATLSTLQHSGRAVIRSVQIGDETINQFGSTIECRASGVSEAGDFLRFLPLFQELDLFEAEVINNTPTESQVQKRYLAYIILIDPALHSELQHSFKQMEPFLCTKDWVVFSEHFELMGISCPKEQAAVLLFGCMIEKESLPSPSMSSIASWNTSGIVRTRADFERPHLNQYLEALQRDGPYAYEGKAADRNKSLLSNLDSITDRLR